MTEAKTFIFLHGGPGYEDYLEASFKDSFPESVDCVFYTQSHGKDVGLRTLLEEVDDHVKGRLSPFLVGHSWGGVLAQKYLQAYPNRTIKGLVLMSSFVDQGKLRVASQCAVAKKSLEHPLLSELFFTDEEFTAATEIRKKIRAFDEGFFKKIHHDFLDNFHGEDFFKKLKLPVLNIFGAEDLRTPARMLKELGKLNRYVRNLEIPNAGHFPFILAANRELITRSMFNFLEKPRN